MVSVVLSSFEYFRLVIKAIYNFINVMLPIDQNDTGNYSIILMGGPPKMQTCITLYYLTCTKNRILGPL